MAPVSIIVKVYHSVWNLVFECIIQGAQLKPALQLQHSGLTLEPVRLYETMLCVLLLRQMYVYLVVFANTYRSNTCTFMVSKTNTKTFIQIQILYLDITLHTIHKHIVWNSSSQKGHVSCYNVKKRVLYPTLYCRTNV